MKSKSKMKHAISLIILVVTILVLSILAAAVIISLSNSNIMAQASSTVFKSDMANFKEAYEMYVIGKFADNADYDRSTLNVTYANNNKEVFEDIFGENVSDKYKEGLQIVNGKLVYVTEDDAEKDILEDLGIASSTTVTPSGVIGKETVTVNGETRSEYIGYYADTDGDGTVDGVIFADLAYTVTGKQWYNSDGAFEYTAVDNLKDYVVSQESYSVEGATGFGTKPVLKATGNGADRFYVMALSDITSTGTTDNYFTWYDAAYDSGISDYSTVTSTAFGKGKANTVKMITAWNKKTYGAQNDRSGYLDMWGVIQQEAYGEKYSYAEDETAKTEADVKWFVPSRAEWGAFGYAFGLTSSNYGTFGLKNYYWSSSLSTTNGARVANFDDGYMDYGGSLRNARYVRLAATF